MGLFGSKTRRRRARVLTAAGTRVDLSNRNAVRQLAISRNGQAWQADAWGYRDLIGELRFAGTFKARAVGRVKFFPAQIVPDQDEPVPFGSDGVPALPAGLAEAAEEELARLPLDAGYRFIGVLDENLSFTGECWLHGYTDDAGEEQWEVLSVSEVILGQDGMVQIRRAGEGATHVIDPDSDEELLRLWVPHPRWGNLADSPMRALQDVCEAIVLAGQEDRAVSRSRVAANGIFKIPRGLTLLLATRDDTISADDDGFMAELTAVLTAPIGNEGHPGSVAPAGLVGELEDLKGFEHMRIDRESSADIVAKIEQKLGRLARGLDIPPEIITGMGDANHWSAWQIDSSTYRYHIDPSVRTVADALTEAFLRPALIARGFTPAEVRQVTVWRDAGVLTENPNRGQDAKDAFDRGSIGFEALNNALGFSPADMPSDEELVKMIALKIGVDTNTSAMLLRAVLGTAVPEVAAQPQPRVIEQARPGDDPATAPGDTPPDNSGDATPGTQPPGLTAAGKALVDALMADGAPHGYTEQADLSRALMDIDRSLTDRLLVAAEEALARGLEKAGARVRGKAAKNPTVRASLNDVDVERMAAYLGRDAVYALGIRETELLGGVFDRLEVSWNAWVLSAIAQSVRITLRMLGVSRSSQHGLDVANQVTAAMTARMPRAWAQLRDELMGVAEHALYNPDDINDTPGERSTFRVPAGVLRRAISEVGGPVDAVGGDRPELPGGIGAGSTVMNTLSDHGAAVLGFEWVYGVADRTTFEPHLSLDGERFLSWSDDRLATPPQYAWIGPYFFTGDHNGCQCSYMPMWITPEPETDLSDRRTVADRIRAFRDRWLRRTR